MKERSTAFEQELISLRREFHRYPEICWTEFRTTARIIEELEKLGLPVTYGRAVHAEEKMLDLPEPAELEACMERAKAEGARPDLVDAMAGGFTGCMTVIEGVLPGPVTGVRVDMDALTIREVEEAGHMPEAEGFASAHEGLMHACGHDAHAAIGVGIARLLCERREELHGKVILVFQPGEEGLRGAASMTAAGLLADCDYFFGLHVGMEDLQVGTVAASVRDLLASTKFDVTFHGKASHAGKAPEQGRNALAAAAMAVMGLLSIPRHQAGITRVNVGTLHAGASRNSIPEEAVLEAETRGGTSEINDYLEKEARRICLAAAEMTGCTAEIVEVSRAESAKSDPPLVQRIAEILEGVEGVETVLPEASFGACEDVVVMMKEVQKHGGQAAALLFGMPLKAPHHSGHFDVDEGVIPLAARCMAQIVLSVNAEG